MVTILSHNTHLTTLPHLIRRRQLSFDPKPNFREEICYPISQRITCNSIKTHVDGRRVHDLTSTRCKRPIFGSVPWLSSRHDSSSYMRKQGNEELGDSDDDSPARHSSAEIARNVIKANENAWLLFPGLVHSEPHVHTSWADFQYLSDYKGDVYFEISKDEKNILEAFEFEERYLVNAVIGMDITANEDLDQFKFSIFGDAIIEDVNRDCDKRMNHPSNGVSIFGYLRRAYTGEFGEFSKLRGLYKNSINDLYKLVILKIKLHCVYGSQSEISLLEFEDVKPDIHRYNSSFLVDHFNTTLHQDALQALCKYKGLDVEEAMLIGVDSLGMDVRVFPGFFSGQEAKTHRFGFEIQANSRYKAARQIMQLLYLVPRQKGI